MVLAHHEFEAIHVFHLLFTLFMGSFFSAILNCNQASCELRFARSAGTSKLRSFGVLLNIHFVLFLFGLFRFSMEKFLSLLSFRTYVLWIKNLHDAEYRTDWEFFHFFFCSIQFHSDESTNKLNLLNGHVLLDFNLRFFFLFFFFWFSFMSSLQFQIRIYFFPPSVFQFAVVYPICLLLLTLLLLYYYFPTSSRTPNNLSLLARFWTLVTFPI